MGALPESFASSCRACGAPRAPDAPACSFCGSTECVSGDVLLRLVAHRARMRRALQQLRAAVTPQVLSVTRRPGQIFVLAGLILGLPLVSIFAAVGPPAIWLVVARPRGALAVFGALVVVAASVLGTAGGLYLAFRAVRAFAARIRQQARALVLEIDATLPVTCSQCGGHAALVVLGPDEAFPCPWCGTPLLPASDASAALRSAAQALMSRHEQVSEALTRQALAGRAADPRSTRKPPPPGFELTAGGVVARGTTAGVPLRAFNDLVGSTFVWRVEVPRDTGLAGEVWFVRPAAESAFRELAGEWGYELPSRRAPESQGFRVYGEAHELGAAGEAVAEFLGGLGPADALLLDPAGLSLWRRGSLLGEAWPLLAEQHARLATLTGALPTNRRA